MVAAKKLAVKPVLTASGRVYAWAERERLGDPATQLVWARDKATYDGSKSSSDIGAASTRLSNTKFSPSKRLSPLPAAHRS